MTWPRDRRLVPPLARIDHVLTRGPIVVTHIGTGDGRGSDHHPLVAEVALL
jgi:endonuclease/exonuclease/phosphatase (EEP) superfamily protein YafD